LKHDRECFRVKVDCYKGEDDCYSDEGNYNRDEDDRYRGLNVSNADVAINFAAKMIATLLKQSRDGI